MKSLENARMPGQVQAVLNLLNRNNMCYEVREFSKPAHHASEAAELLGCPLGAVVKSLVFQKTETTKLLLVLVSGKNRADIGVLSQIFGVSVQPSSPLDVLKYTGYKVGSVPPFGIRGNFPVIIDADLMAYQQVWAAAGSAYVLMGLSPMALHEMCNGQVVPIKAL